MQAKKNQILKLRLVGLLLLVISLGRTQSQDRDLIQFLDELTTKQIDTLGFENFSKEDQKIILNYGIELSEDTTDLKQQFKGEVLIAAFASFYKAQIQEKEINTKSKEARFILAQLKSKQHNVYQPKVSNIKKLLHYFCQGKYVYIYKRVSGLALFYPSVAFLLITLLIFFLNLKRFKAWQHSGKVQKMALILSAFILLSILLFKTTCNA